MIGLGNENINYITNTILTPIQIKGFINILLPPGVGAGVNGLYRMLPTNRITE